MKRKVFAGLLAGMLVCLAFVLTNASDSSYTVSGTAKVYWNGMDLRQPVQIQVQSSLTDEITKYKTEMDGSFSIRVNYEDQVTYSYSDQAGSASETRSYTSSKSNESIHLNYTPHSSTH